VATSRVLAALVLVPAFVVGARARPAPAGPGPEEKPPFRVAFVGPLSGPLVASGHESLLGVRYAGDWHVEQGGVAGRKVEVVSFDDHDDPAAAEKAYAAAEKAKVDAIVAAPTGRTAEAFVARARKGRIPTAIAGAVGPKPTVDARDPVIFVGSYPVDHALAVANALAVPCRSTAPAIVYEDTPRGRETEAAIRRNLGPVQRPCASVKVAAGARIAAADVAALRDAKCDRLVVVGEPDLLDRTFEATTAAGFAVPFLATEGMASEASTWAFDESKQEALRGTYFLVGSPQRTVDGPPSSLYRSHEKARGSGAPVWPRTIQAFLASDLLLEGAKKASATAGRKGLDEAAVIAGARDVRYGPEESEVPLLDVCGYASLYHWRIWKAAAKGPVPIDEQALPIEGFGPPFRLRNPSRYVAEPGTKVVWVTFADGTRKKPSTITTDLADLGLSTRGYEPQLDAWILDDLMARALGKLNRLFLRNEDGTAIPGVSFAISFTPVKPTSLKPSEYWTAFVAGDDADAGGRAWPGDGYCEIYSTFLKRTIFQRNALDPRVGTDDKTYVEGTFPFRVERGEHRRPDAIRCLVDGYAGAFALTGAHEIGHLASLDHDTSDPRSIMNVAEGAGLRETQAWFVPSHAAILEKVLGRVPDPAAKERRR
jgi:ABC-type branched-subunit amino acid transport system substrate-binding protein